MMVLAILSVCGCGAEEGQSNAAASRPAPPSRPVKSRESVAQRENPPRQSPGNARADRDATADGNGTARRDPDRRGYGRDRGESIEKQPRPTDVAEWKPNDFRSARLEKDRKLTEAIRVAGEKWPHNKKLVQLLVELLAVEAPPGTSSEANDNGDRGYDRAEKFGHEGGFGRAGGRSQLIHVDSSAARAIIEALGRSETPQALETLENLIMGRQEAPLEFSAIVTEVLKSLTSDVTAEREELLLRFFTHPDSIRQAPSKFVSTSASRGGSRPDRGFGGSRGSQGGGIDPIGIQRQILQQAGPDTSAKFRTGMARYLDDPSVTVETADIAEQFLAADDPRNLTAQLILYRNPETAGRTRDQLVARLVAGSGSMLDILFGIPPQAARFGRGGYSDRGRGYARGYADKGRGYADKERGGRPSSRPSSRPSREADAEATDEPDVEQLHCDFVRHLWIPATIAPLVAEIQKADRFAARSEIPLLLASIPLSESRDALGKLFEARKDEGPRPWTSLGMFDRKTVDPGILVVAKNAYYKRSGRRSPASRTSGGSVRSGASARSGGTAPIDAQQREWATAVEKLVGALCERCQDASQLRAEVDTAAAESMPVKIPKNANIVAEYHVRWPEKIDPRLSSIPVGLLDLHYVRIEDEAQPDRAVSAFRRLAGQAEERTIPGGVWLDGFSKGSQRSTDIRITSTSRGVSFRDGKYDRDRGYDRGSRPTGRDEAATKSVPLVIEILTVAIIEPQPKP